MNEIAYDFVGGVAWATCFPCVNLPEYVSLLLFFYLSVKAVILLVLSTCR